MLKILHVVPSSEISSGGTFIAASNLSDSLISLGVSCHIVAQKYDKDEALARNVETPLTIIPSKRLFNTGYSPKLKSTILRLASYADIIHAHGVWNYHLSCVSHVSRIRNTPLIISPHGMLEPWIVSRSKLKKQIANIIYQKSSLRKCACIHALSIAEMNNLRALKINNPIAVIPNGTCEPGNIKRANKSVLSERYPDLFKKKIILFLSRIHPKKGLINLLAAWRKMAKELNKWHLIIAGPDDHDHLKTVNKYIKELDLGSCVTIVGSVADEQKAHLYSTSQAFILPSFSEGFSMSILEAMSYGLPCIYTEQCNFPEGRNSGAAFIGYPTIDSIKEMLSQLISLSEAERLEMGNKGKLLISRSYNWDRVAKLMHSLYLAIQKGAEFPNFVNFK